MKEKDLRDKFKPYAHGTDVIDNIAHTDNNIWNNSTDQCVQIAKDYAEQKVRNAKLPYQLFIGKVADILGKEKTSELLKESIEAFKNRENER